VHPDAEQAADGTLRISAQGGYVVAERHKNLYRDAMFPRTPNMLSPADVIKSKPAWADAFAMKSGAASQAILSALQSGEQEEIRLRARMMAAVDEGVGAIIDVLEKSGQLDNTFIVFMSDNGFFFGEHGLGPERRFAYEEGIRSPFVVRYPRKVKAGSRRRELVVCQDLAPTLIEFAGGKPGPQIQGRSLLPLFAPRRAPWRKSILIEYWAEQAMPWLVGMTYKAVRTDRYKYIHWVNRGKADELDELYDLERDPYEIDNLNRSRKLAPVRDKLRRELKRLVAEAVGL
jgi:N-acetylglucosamine-6-sulfatase